MRPDDMRDVALAQVIRDLKYVLRLARVALIGFTVGLLVGLAKDVARGDWGLAGLDAILVAGAALMAFEAHRHARGYRTVR